MQQRFAPSHIVCLAFIACHSCIQDFLNENSAREILMPDNNIDFDFPSLLPASPESDLNLNLNDCEP